MSSISAFRFAAAVALGASVTFTLPAHSQPALSPTPLSDSVLFRRVDSLVAANPGFSGVVAIGRGGAVVHLAAAGVVTPGGARPTAETAFNLGSINKLFTQIVVRQLAAEQGWSLDTTLAGVWPDYPNRDVARDDSAAAYPPEWCAGQHLRRRLDRARSPAVAARLPAIVRERTIAVRPRFA
jgi:CubicO group peptidase (beta-lactamase class C family)